jgi:uncharacterized protein (DUF58 family)
VATAVGLVAAGVGTGTRTLLLAALVPLAFVVQGAVSSLDDLEGRVRVERTVSPETPLPGQPVEVRLRVRNVGDAPIPDCRVVDGAPPELAVTNGDAREGAPLRRGEAMTATYTLTANRGSYAFRPASLRARSASGTVLTETTVDAEGDDEFDCRVAVDDVPLGRRRSAFTGARSTDTGGAGVEFYATRDYRTGDPASRIDWRRYAKTGALSTVEYREQRAARVAVVIDARAPARVAPTESLPTGATLAAYAATLAVGVLRDSGHHVSVGALGVEDPITGDHPAWVPPDGDGRAAHAAAVCNAAAAGPGEGVPATAVVADGGRRTAIDRLLGRLPATAQLLYCTPATDDATVGAVETARARGHEVTVLAPDVSGASIGGRIVGLERALRLDRMRGVGATVIDWDRRERLPLALARALRAEVR